MSKERVSLTLDGAVVDAMDSAREYEARSSWVNRKLGELLLDKKE